MERQAGISELIEDGQRDFPVSHVWFLNCFCGEERGDLLSEHVCIDLVCVCISERPYLLTPKRSAFRLAPMFSLGRVSLGTAKIEALQDCQSPLTMNGNYLASELENVFRRMELPAMLILRTHNALAAFESFQSISFPKS